ncbi:MAG: tetratricopeptide repeat protein [Methanophagales archaeon]|nr:tetratricopeptide repeat protein [Methanophagales archaeon]
MKQGELAEEWFSKAESLVKIGRLEESLEYYDKVLKMDSRDVDAWNNKGDTLAQLGKHNEAINCFDKALEILPKNSSEYADILINKGNSFVQLKKFEEALDYYDEAVKVNPQNERAWFNKGSLLYLFGKKREAKQCFDKVCQLSPKSREVVKVLKEKYGL